MASALLDAPQRRDAPHHDRVARRGAQEVQCAPVGCPRGRTASGSAAARASSASSSARAESVLRTIAAFPRYFGHGLGSHPPLTSAASSAAVQLDNRPLSDWLARCPASRPRVALLPRPLPTHSDEWPVNARALRSTARSVRCAAALLRSAPCSSSRLSRDHACGRLVEEAAEGRCHRRCHRRSEGTSELHQQKGHVDHHIDHVPQPLQRGRLSGTVAQGLKGTSSPRPRGTSSPRLLSGTSSPRALGGPRLPRH